MKKLKLFIGLFFFLTANLFAQQGINYKAILSDNGAVLQNQAVDVQFSILRDGTTLEYQETHSTTTDANGIIVLTIGEGTVLSGLYNSIHWYAQQFLKVEIDTGSGYIDFGTTAFKTVPYAIYAENGDGAKKIGDLADAKKDITSIYLGNESGSSETESNLDNTAVGNFALKYNTIGMSNNAIGVGALHNNLTGYSNVANGSNSLSSNTSGNANIAIGAYTLTENSIGSNNTALGKNAGYNSLGNNNIFLGYKAGYNETASDKLYIENTDSATPLIGGDFSTDEVTINGSLAIVDGTQGVAKVLTSDADGKASWQLAPASGAMAINELSDAKTDGSSLFMGASSGALDDGDNNNVGIGNQTLAMNSSGAMNTAVGKNALNANIDGAENTAIGFEALNLNIAGGFNVANGAYALAQNISGDYNTAIGHYALFENTTGRVNLANGAYALKGNTTGNANIAIGNDALMNNTIGSYNTALGIQAGQRSNGDRNVFLGYQAGFYETASNKLYIENSNSATPLIGGDFATDEVTINGSLDVTGNISGKIKAADSGDADLKAYIYGSITSMGPFTANGAQTDGFDVTRIATGVYDVVFTNPPGNNLYTVISSMRFGDIGFISVNNATDKFTIRTYNTSGVAADKAFNFVVYKK